MSENFPKNTAREAILARVRGAGVQSAKPVTRGYRQNSGWTRAEILEQFAERVAEYKAEVIRGREEDLSALLERVCSQRNLLSIVVPAGLETLNLPSSLARVHDEPTPLTPEQLETCDAVLTGCALGIAETGTIVLDGGPGQGRRVLSLIPDTHLCIVRERQLLGSVPEGVAALEGSVNAGRALTLISGPSATSDIELSRVEGVHGPRNLVVFLLEESL